MTLAFHRQGNSGVLYSLMAKPLQLVTDKAGSMGAEFQIIVSYRDAVAQMAAYRAGKSKAKPGQSPHNFNPSRAFDFIPHPFAGWDKIPPFRVLAHIFYDAGHLIGVPVTWGGDWNGNGIETDQTLFDADHIELTAWKHIK